MIDCLPPTRIDASAFYVTRCTVSHGVGLTPAEATWDYNTAWIVDSAAGNPRIVMHFDGWPGFSPPTISGGLQGHIVVKNEYSHHPLDRWEKPTPLDWGGPFRGENSNGERYAATLDEIAAQGYAIDSGAGLIFQGNCYGGSAAVTQALLIPDRWQSQVAIVDALLPGMTADEPAGMAWRDNADWFPLDPRDAQHARHLDKLKNIYFRFRASSYPADYIGFNQQFLRDVCDAGRIYCYAQWGRQGHAWPDPEAPTAYRALQGDWPWTGRFAGPGMDWRLDTMKVIPTESSANVYGPRGHYNMGIQWRDITDTAQGASVAMRYARQTNLGPLLPDMPESVTFKLTLRPIHLQLRAGTLVAYTLDGVERFAYVEREGEVTFPVTLPNSAEYRQIAIRNHYIEGC